MLRILLVSARQEVLVSLAEGLSADPSVHVERVSSGAEALQAVRATSPHLVVIDVGLPDAEPLSLAREMLMLNAMVNTAVVSPLSEEAFHEVSEGLGVLAHLPLTPGPDDTVALLDKLKRVLGLASTA